MIKSKGNCQGAWLARSVECATLDPRVVSSSPTFVVGITLKNKILKKKRVGEIVYVAPWSIAGAR